MPGEDLRPAGSAVRWKPAAIAMALAAALFPFQGHAQSIPMIDAHSQLPSSSVAGKVVPLMNAAGIDQVILSFRGDTKGRDVIELAHANPGRVVPSIRLKGNWAEDPRSFSIQLASQAASGAFRAIGEVLVYHAQKGSKAPGVSLATDAPQFREVLELARQRRWPLVVHIEFAAAPDRAAYWEMLDGLLSQNPDVAFPLIHMGQLDPASARRLLDKYRNVYFMTSHANPVVTALSAQPWTNMFAGDSLVPEWRRLMIEKPDRFILAFDNVYPEHWSDLYVRQAQFWRRALAELPPAAAHKIAHQNAERLWRLAPARVITAADSR